MAITVAERPYVNRVVDRTYVQPVNKTVVDQRYANIFATYRRNLEIFFGLRKVLHTAPPEAHGTLHRSIRQFDGLLDIMEANHPEFYGFRLQYAESKLIQSDEKKANL